MNPDLGDVTSHAAEAPPPEAGIATATPRPATATAVPVPTRLPETERPLTTEHHFYAGVYADDIGPVRLMAFASNGDLYATVPKENRVLALPDRDGDGVVDEVFVYAEGEPLNKPHGIAFHGPWLYIANTDSVWRYAFTPGDLVAADAPERVVDNIPGGEQHWTRTLVFGPDERMYVSVGSSCNLCVEDNFLRASVLRFNSDGSAGSQYARGLRNAVGLAFHPRTGELWATENGRDLLGDDLPPDEINLVAAGVDYGWPACFGQQVPDPEVGANPEFCARTAKAAVEIQAHSAPLGLTFYQGDAFPEDYRHDMFVAYHGSWNRSIPTGYKVVRIPFADGRPVGGPVDFVSGWLLPDTDRWGRPVDVITAPDGALLVSDDAGHRIYRVVYAPVEPTATPWR